MTLNVGDVRTLNGKPVTVTDIEPTPNGEITVRDAERYVLLVKPEALDPERATWRATHPELGNVTIDLPTDGKAEVRAVWSQAATERTT